jgi:hypothetical protein
MLDWSLRCTDGQTQCVISGGHCKTKESDSIPLIKGLLQACNLFTGYCLGQKQQQEQQHLLLQ